MDDFWKDAEVIVSYTRARAIADGVLRDVSTIANEAGFKFPVALTAAAWSDAVQWSKENATYQDEAGRLWDVVYMAAAAIRRPRGRRMADSPRTTYPLYRVPNEKEATEATELVLEMHIGPGDDGEAVITIGLPGED